jgi:hypothetical protein
LLKNKRKEEKEMIRMECVELCNQKAQKRKAMEYSRKVRFQKAKKTMLGILTGIFFVCGVGYVGNEELESVIAATETVSETEEYYVICDVDETEIGANDETILAVIMQDGSIQNYEITDAPEYISEVCFKTDNLDNFTSYEVVALR